MKAIILVDIPDYYNLDDIRAYCSLHTQHGEILLKNGNYFDVKPLPQKKEVNLPNDRVWSKDEIMAYTHGISVGFNECLDGLGETE